MSQLQLKIISMLIKALWSSLDSSTRISKNKPLPNRKVLHSKIKKYKRKIRDVADEFYFLFLEWNIIKFNYTLYLLTIIILCTFVMYVYPSIAVPSNTPVSNRFSPQLEIGKNQLGIPKSIIDYREGEVGWSILEKYEIFFCLVITLLSIVVELKHCTHITCASLLILTISQTSTNSHLLLTSLFLLKFLEVDL